MAKREKKAATPAMIAMEKAKEAYKGAKERNEKQDNDASKAALAKSKEKLAETTDMVNRERFENVIGIRVGKIISMIQTLRNGSNRRSYTYTEADVTKMFEGIGSELKVTQATFVSALKAGGKDKAATPAKFSF